MIRVNGISKTFNGTVAVDNVSFELRERETFGLLGPNGAGKTTTINIMVGVLQPDAGSVDIDDGGSPLDAGIRRKIGNAPQSLAIYDSLSAEENIRFFGRLYGLRGSHLKKRTEWVLEFAGLTDRRKDRAAAYSGGMKRRLNLACALVHDPPILLLDEPTVGVDPQSRNHIFDSIERLKEENRTIIYTTHYMEEAQRLCDRVAIIDHGKILALDTVDNLIEQHGGKSVIQVNLFAPPEKDIGIEGAVVDGTNLRIETGKPLEVLAQLASHGLKFNTMNVEKADLESVFLNLTGRRLRD